MGMLRLLLEEFQDAINKLKKSSLSGTDLSFPPQNLSLATGKLAYPYIRQMADELSVLIPELSITVYPIRNDFFGEMITVSGLLTGGDIIAQLKDKPLRERLLLPQNVLRSKEEVFLDDVTLKDMEKALQVPIDIVKSSGYDFVSTILKEV